MNASEEVITPTPNPPVEEPWSKPESRLENLKGSKGGKNYSHTGGINSSFEGALFGAVDPHGVGAVSNVLHEKPVHRLMQTMLAKGFTIDEIAQETGYTRVRVGVILRQPWAQMNIVDDIKRSVTDEIKNFLETEVVPTLHVLKNLRDDPDSPKAVRKSACDSILDRFMGKPNQPISTQTVDPSKLTTQELERRVSQIVTDLAAEGKDSKES